MKCHQSEERSSQAPLNFLLLLISIVTFIGCVFVSSPVMAAPYTVHNLTSDSLLGSTSSRQELQLRMRLYEARMRTAAGDLGLTATQYQAFRTRLFDAPYVVIPRRLNAMVGYAHGTPYVLRDVIIPANTRGWEVDLVNGDEVAQVFIPAVCGNLSILRSLRPHLADVATQTPRVAVVRTPIATPIPTAAPDTEAPAQAAVTTPVPAVAAVQPAFQISSPPVLAHRGHFPWWIAVLVVPFIHGGGGTQPPAYHAPVLPTPPPVVGCKP